MASGLVNLYFYINPSIYHNSPSSLQDNILYTHVSIYFCRSKLSEPDNAWRFRNYFRTKADEIFSEQTPGTQRRINNFSVRLRKLNKKYNPVKRDKAPSGKEIIRRHLIGGATSLADILDGKHAVKVTPPQRPPQRKKRSRKSKVVK